MAALADIDGVRKACVAQPSADDVACEGQFQTALDEAKQRIATERQASIDRQLAELNFDSTQDLELDARLAKEIEDRIAKVDERIQQISANANARADQIAVQVRAC